MMPHRIHRLSIALANGWWDGTATLLSDRCQPATRDCQTMVRSASTRGVLDFAVKIRRCQLCACNRPSSHRHHLVAGFRVGSLSVR
jgi:hypothetical protein